MVVVLEAGKVKAIGPPGEVFGTFAGETAESRFDRSSVLTMKVRGTNEAYGLTELAHPAGTVWLAGPAGALGSTVRIIVKATDVVLSVDPPHHLSVRSCLSGRIDAVQENGPLATVAVTLDGDGHLFAMATRHALDELGLVPGAPVYALIKTTALDERKVAAVSPNSVSSLNQSGRSTAEPGDGGESPEPGPRRREQYIDRVFRIADHREGGEEVPDAAPIRGPDPAPRHDRGGEGHRRHRSGSRRRARPRRSADL